MGLSEARASLVALISLSFACAGGTHLNGVSAARLLSQPDVARDAGLDGDRFIEALLPGLRRDPCAVTVTLAGRDSVFGADVERQLHEVDRAARALCQVGARGVRAGFGPDGEIELDRGEPSSRTRRAFVVHDASGGAEVRVRAPRTEFAPAECTDEGGGDPRDTESGQTGPSSARQDLDVVLLDVNDARLRIRDEHRHQLWTAPSGADACQATRAGAGGVTLEPEDARAVWVTSDRRGATVTLEVDGRRDAGRGWGARRWTPGDLITIETRVGPFTLPAPESQFEYCAGFIGEAPTLVLAVREEGSVEVAVDSDDDPVLVVRGPEGEIWCNDDYDGLNPLVFGYFTPGVWEVFVGSFSPAASFEATLRIE